MTADNKKRSKAAQNGNVMRITPDLDLEFPCHELRTARKVCFWRQKIKQNGYSGSLKVKLLTAKMSNGENFRRPQPAISLLAAQNSGLACSGNGGHTAKSENCLPSLAKTQIPKNPSEGAELCEQPKSPTLAHLISRVTGEVARWWPPRF